MLLVPLLLVLHLSPCKIGAPARDYETYVLALEWQPSRSIDACPGGKQQDS